MYNDIFHLPVIVVAEYTIAFPSALFSIKKKNRVAMQRLIRSKFIETGLLRKNFIKGGDTRGGIL